MYGRERGKKTKACLKKKKCAYSYLNALMSDIVYVLPRENNKLP